MALLLLQFVNAALAGASLGIHFLNPGLWDDQAIVFSTLTGTTVVCVTAVFLGASMVFSGESRWRSHLLNLALTLLFAACQGYLLWVTSRAVGIIQLIKSRLG